MEAGERRIDVDDLVAIAVALGVSPIGLLMPHTDEPTTPVAVVDNVEPAPADQVWDWLCALEPLPGTPTGTRPEHGWVGLRAGSWPPWKWEQFAAGDELQRREAAFNAELTRRARGSRKEGEEPMTSTTAALEARALRLVSRQLQAELLNTVQRGKPQ